MHPLSFGGPRLPFLASGEPTRPLARIERLRPAVGGITPNGLLAPLWMRVPGLRWFGSKSGIIMFVPDVAHYDRLCTPGGTSGLSFDGLEPYLAPTLSASARFGGFGHFSQPSSPQPSITVLSLLLALGKLPGLIEALH